MLSFINTLMTSPKGTALLFCCIHQIYLVSLIVEQRYWVIMADDVINSLENMKLTADEEETIEIFDEGRRAEIESCTLSLIGKFLTCKPFNKKATKNTLRRAWGLDDKVQMVEVGSNLFQFKFNSEFDLERIFNGGP